MTGEFERPEYLAWASARQDVLEDQRAALEAAVAVAEAALRDALEALADFDSD